MTVPSLQTVSLLQLLCVASTGCPSMMGKLFAAAAADAATSTTVVAVDVVVVEHVDSFSELLSSSCVVRGGVS